MLGGHCRQGTLLMTDRLIRTQRTYLEAFLSNVKNKMVLISLLSHCLQQRGITAHQAAGGAGTSIVSVALHAAALPADDAPVAVVAEDTDITVLLLFHRREYMCDILFLSESKKGRGGKNSCWKMHNYQRSAETNRS
jgi:hypothetical protein